jgi:adenine-specific DNA methylase
MNEIEGLGTEVAQAIATLNLFIGQDKLEEFVHVDDENNEEFMAAVLEDVELLLEMMKIAKENLDDDNDDDIPTSQASNSGLGNIVVFKGFESLYKQVVDVEDQLLYSEVQKKVEETFYDLRKFFELFQSKVQAVTLKVKRKNLQNLRQMTIHDMLN